ncbi:hypothetical protein [Sphingomonas morindae]|uniref:Uncharacterized protein n=1 Tax=Sphingomonas morindae TaxID=1541170 RepID=A0ABY4XA56_9SPHN|nr:hypothetical protein [Sphingomonas morindae]USI73822.1 hypothetical protein LHA26_04975 [Sphingomonas morindae]
MAALLMALAISAGANPLLGKWIGERPGMDRISLSAQPTMTITPEAISFGSGRRELGLVPIAAFERDEKMISVRTRFGELYSFRFLGADHICRVVSSARAATECFTRDRARA